VQELARRLAAVQHDLAAAQAAEATAKQTKTEIEQLTASENAARKDRDHADGKAREASGIVTGREEVFKGREAEVPEALRAPGALERAIEQARVALAALDRALKAAREKAKTAGEKLAGARNTEHAKREAAERAARTAADARATFDTARTGAGFQTVDDFRAALRSEDQIVSVERLIAKFQSDFAAAEDRLKRARNKAEGIRQPDLPALEAAYKQAGERLETCLTQIADLTNKINLARKQLAALDAVLAESERLEKRHRTVARIAEAANGRNNARVNFQRFVQATLLDRVLEAATERLRTMSRGRYELQRTHETLDRRASAGLDLEVFDAHTGAARPVSTLSGGESFQASLSLALGLAGVVQTHAGGLRLESIFIDEGFGSLDADALGLAMDTLCDLQQGGRLIGIVSHVAELKEQIPARLEVKPGRRGSEARFIIN
jgi:exonuclease SbcC